MIKLNEKRLITIGKRRRYFAGYVIIASALMILIVLLQSFKYRIFGTTLLLGWDTPAYVWMAKYKYSSRGRG